jgi:hypothetical protein
MLFKSRSPWYFYSVCVWPALELMLINMHCLQTNSFFLPAFVSAEKLAFEDLWREKL